MAIFSHTLAGAARATHAQMPAERVSSPRCWRARHAFRDCQREVRTEVDDGTLITPGGDYGRGRSGVAKVYSRDCETILDGTTSKFTIVGVRQIGGDCAFLDLEHDLRNFKMPDGSTGPVKLHVVILAQRKGSAWQWLDVRPYAFMQPPGQTH